MSGVWGQERTRRKEKVWEVGVGEGSRTMTWRSKRTYDELGKTAASCSSSYADYHAVPDASGRSDLRAWEIAFAAGPRVSGQTAQCCDPALAGRERPWLAARAAPSLRLRDSAAPPSCPPSTPRAVALRRRRRSVEWLRACAPIGRPEAVRVQYDFAARVAPARPLGRARARDFSLRLAQDTSGSGPDARAFQGL